MIKNVVFDMGQVLIKYEPNLVLEENGIHNPEEKQFLMHHVFQTLAWSRVDRGSLTSQEAYDIMCKKIPERLHDVVKELVFCWHRNLHFVEGMEEVVKELKDNGYGIYLLSNAGLDQKDYWNRIPASRYFDGRVVSAEEGFVKPQPEIYQILCDRYGLNPSECVFIDDSHPNAEGAFFAGWEAIVFHGDVQELREELRDLGVRIS